MNLYDEQSQTSDSNADEDSRAGLPWIFRIVSIERRPLANHLKRNIAHLYHDQAAVSVTWDTTKVDERLSAGSLVSPRWSNKPLSEQGYLQIQRLLPVERASMHVNLFDTIPYEWMQERSKLKEAKVLMDLLPESFKCLFNAIFWDYRRFYRFVVGPSSLNGHHNWKHGNLMHTIEVANHAAQLAEIRPMVNRDVLVLAAFLHDAAKADEYQFNYRRNCFELSPRGTLIGHKLTIIEWIAAAMALYPITIADQHYLGLMHALTAVKSAPDWMGLREPVSPECHLLSLADRLSGNDDLFKQTKPKQEGFGKYHKHLRGRAYLTQSENPDKH